LNKIQINPLLTVVHRRVLHEYLRGEGRLTREQWQMLREAIDLLEQSSLVINEQEYTFKRFYNEFIRIQKEGCLPRKTSKLLKWQKSDSLWNS